MLSAILKKMRSNISNDDAGNRRASPRRVMDQCVGVINGKTYPIVDWSNGGSEQVGSSAAKTSKVISPVAAGLSERSAVA